MMAIKLVGDEGPGTGSDDEDDDEGDDDGSSDQANETNPYLVPSRKTSSRHLASAESVQYL